MTDFVSKGAVKSAERKLTTPFRTVTAILFKENQQQNLCYMDCIALIFDKLKPSL
ncbi:hypothetical protein [Methanospirillum lacunae]|uniref:hypothetical protein n=1 Tax=Methanospirillum lacunae TaxID=668570 RepID=UPI0015E84385|nr:hypothetical protein [Methanospirillum lacunae]